MDLPELDYGSDPRALIERDRRRFRGAALVSAAFVALLWWVHLAQNLLDAPLPALTLRPGDPWGLVGVLTAPLLHGGFGHLASNSLPLLILGTLAIATLPRATPRALLLIWFLAGVGTWLIGRPSNHLGASGITHGLMLFVFVAGLIRRDRPAIAAALIAFFLYGGMLLSVFPREQGVS
jgi:membrane associated rhomboid family serine protease